MLIWRKDPFYRHHLWYGFLHSGWKKKRSCMTELCVTLRRRFNGLQMSSQAHPRADSYIFAVYVCTLAKKNNANVLPVQKNHLKTITRNYFKLRPRTHPAPLSCTYHISLDSSLVHQASQVSCDHRALSSVPRWVFLEISLNHVQSSGPWNSGHTNHIGWNHMRSNGSNRKGQQMSC